MAEFGAHREGFVLLLAAYQHVRQGAERRIPHQLTELDLLRVEAGIILLGSEADSIVLGIDGLDEDDAGQVAASGTSGCMREELERALGRAKVRQAQADIRRHN